MTPREIVRWYDTIAKIQRDRLQLSIRGDA
jgi:hypothetical protein